MRLSRIYLDTRLMLASRVDLPPATSHYIKNVLRLKHGQKLILFNGQEPVDYTAQIEISGKKISATPLSSNTTETESALHISLIQALGKPEHTDLLVQKATELGANEIRLFNAERTQTHLKSSRLEKKLAHWHGIIRSACEQCGRNFLPSLSFSTSLTDCLQALPASNKLLLDLNGQSIKQLHQKIDPAASFYLLVGPEGGFSLDETELAKKLGFLSCVLGPRVLRMETAAISIVNLMQHHFGDM